MSITPLLLLGCSPNITGEDLDASLPEKDSLPPDEAAPPIENRDDRFAFANMCSMPSLGELAQPPLTFPPKTGPFKTSELRVSG